MWGRESDDELYDAGSIPHWLRVRRRPSPATRDIRSTVRGMASTGNLDMEPDTAGRILSLLGYELGLHVSQYNREIRMDILAKINAAHGVLDRVTAKIDGKLEKVFELEKKADDLSDRATAPKIAQLDTINAHLTEVVNALEGNGGPPLSGNPSTPSDGQSTENPT